MCVNIYKSTYSTHIYFYKYFGFDNRFCGMCMKNRLNFNSRVFCGGGEILFNIYSEYYGFFQQIFIGRRKYVRRKYFLGSSGVQNDLRSFEI